MPGHDSRHAHRLAPPIGLSWGEYLEHFVKEHGSWTALADELSHRATGVVETSFDLQTVERGLRRLASRDNKPAGQYGRWMLRFFGVPPAATRWAQELGQYHSRFADLPTSLRLEQLRLWDRPPVSESSIASWVHIGLASVLHRMQDLESCKRHLSLAMQGAERAGPAACMEARLLQARILTDEGDRPGARRLFDEVESLLHGGSIEREDTLCYRARLIGQRGYHLTKAALGESPRYEEARSLFASLEEDHRAPFACFRRNSGLAYCTWKLGDVEEGIRLAQIAAEFAGDGGYVRFRIMALNMLSLMVDPAAGLEISARAERLAEKLEDSDLVERVRSRARKIKP